MGRHSIKGHICFKKVDSTLPMLWIQDFEQIVDARQILLAAGTRLRNYSSWVGKLLTLNTWSVFTASMKMSIN